MTRPISGLNALAGYSYLVDEDSQATPEERMGGVADPAHGKFLAQENIPRGSYAGEPHGPYGPENQILGDEGWFWESGGEPSEDPTMDHTPSTRAGPWPKGILSGANTGDVGPDATAERLIQSFNLHGVNTNAEKRSQTGGTEALNDEWETVEQLNPGNSDLVSLPKQSQSSGTGWGTRDRTQSMGRQNEFGFDSSHQHRRYATGAIPGNTMWLKPGGRPIAKSIAGGARPAIGDNSPFTGQDLGFSFNPDGAVLQNVPSEYSPPPTPNLTAAPQPVATGSDAYVEWY